MAPRIPGARRVDQDAVERLEERYMAGLRVRSDQRIQGMLNMAAYGAGALIWWALAPRMPVYGWQRTLLWALSFWLAYLALRSIAVVAASAAWLDAVAARRGKRRGLQRLSPLRRIRQRRIEHLWRNYP